MATGHVRWSPELFTVFGLDPDGPVPDFADQQRLFSPESWQRLSAAVGQTQAAGTPYELELEIVRADGSRAWAEARGEAIRDAHGTIVELHGVSLDITDRKAARDELRALATHDPDGAGEPRRAAGGGHPGGQRERAVGSLHGHPDDGPRPVQGGQRHPGPRGRGRAAGGRRGRLTTSSAPVTSWPGWVGTSSWSSCESCRTRRRPCERRVGSCTHPGPVHRRRSGAVRDRERRGRGRRSHRPGRRPAARGRHGDVRGEGGRSRPCVDVDERLRTAVARESPSRPTFGMRSVVAGSPSGAAGGRSAAEPSYVRARCWLVPSGWVGLDSGSVRRHG